MSTTEFAEEYLGIKLTQCQKDYMDYLDRNPTYSIMIPRSIGFNTTYELWLLASCLR